MFSNKQNKTIKHYGNPQTQGLPIDISSLLEDLLLNDEIIIDSLRFGEIAELIKVIGLDSTYELFKSNNFKILLDPMDAGFCNVNHYEQPLKPDEYNLVVFKIGDYSEYIHNAFLNLEKLSGSKGKKFIKLKGLIAGSLLKYDEQADKILLDQSRNDLKDGQFPIEMLAYALTEKNIKTDENFRTKIKANISWQTDNLFKCETNLTEVAQVKPADIVGIIQSAVFGINACNKKILEMQEFDSKNEFREKELFVLGNKLDNIAEINTNNKNKVALNRVFSLKDIPEIKLTPKSNIDVGKFNKIKQSKECKEFREWLRTINDKTTDKEILDYINSFKSRISNAYNSTSSKTIRFLANTVVGIINTPASVGFGAIDTFLLNKILPENGVVSFINNKIPSIFKDS